MIQLISFQSLRAALYANHAVICIHPITQSTPSNTLYRSLERHNRLGVLPCVWLGLVGGKRIEAKALITEGDALEVGIDLPWTLLRVAGGSAGEETTLSDESTEALALSELPAAGDGAFGCAC